MTDIEYCIDYLERKNNIKTDKNMSSYDRLRALMNITMPYDLSEEFYSRQDKVLGNYRKEQVVDALSLPRIADNIAIHQGDITLLKTDAIVNACNEKMLGCFVPLHACVDNCIHSAAGLQVRRDMMKIMGEQGHDEENGLCKVTSGYNLPSKFIFHTVGPKVFGKVTNKNEQDLKNCYLSSLNKADEMGLRSIAFCSVSTGVYGYPIERASEIAISTVKEYLKTRKTLELVVFVLFSKGDYDVYNRRLEESYF